jgi:hypothetical protein
MVGVRQPRPLTDRLKTERTTARSGPRPVPVRRIFQFVERPNVPRRRRQPNEVPPLSRCPRRLTDRLKTYRTTARSRPRSRTTNFPICRTPKCPTTPPTAQRGSAPLALPASIDRQVENLSYDGPVRSPSRTTNFPICRTPKCPTTTPTARRGSATHSMTTSNDRQVENLSYDGEPSHGIG